MYHITRKKKITNSYDYDQKYRIHMVIECTLLIIELSWGFTSCPYTYTQCWVMRTFQSTLQLSTNSKHVEHSALGERVFPERYSDERFRCVLAF